MQVSDHLLILDYISSGEICAHNAVCLATMRPTGILMTALDYVRGGNVIDLADTRI